MSFSDVSNSDSPAKMPQEERVLSIQEMRAFVVRCRYLIARVAAVFVVGIGLIVLRQPRSYTATASFVAQARNSRASGMSGLAAPFGISLASGDASQSPAFYSALLKSHGVVDATLISMYDTSGTGRSQETLLKLLKVDGATEAERRARGLLELESRISIATDLKTGIVTVRTTMENARLSQQVGARMLELLNQFNLSSRRSQASAERQFAERRVSEIADSLRRAEEEVKNFLNQNRGDFSRTPELQFRYQTLERSARQREQQYVSLVQALEQARLDEVRDTPVIVVLDAPIVPAWPDPRGRIRKMVLALAVGLALGVLTGLLLESAGMGPIKALGSEEDSPWNWLREDLQHPTRTIRRIALGTRPGEL